MSKCIILSGIPCSGKSSWARKQGLPILSCDDIRLELNNGKYIFDPKKESEVWITFYERVSKMQESFIVDNTNCKHAYIKHIIEELPEGFIWEIKRFDISLWKAQFRNIVRYLKTGKKIPFKVLKAMNKNYKKLWS